MFGYLIGQVLRTFSALKGFLAQFNVGVGFLYFSGVSGNLMGRPASNLQVQASGEMHLIRGSFLITLLLCLNTLLGTNSIIG